MTTEKYTETAETFKKNVTDTMKWLQDTTATIIETQNKQMKSASEMYSKAINATLEGINKDNFNSSFGWSETVMEILKKNIETISEMSKATMKTATEFGKQAGSETFSKGTTDKIIESYKKQAEDITAWNKKSFDMITKQFETTKTSYSPWAEKFKKEFEASVASSKTNIQSIIDTYSKLTNPSVETNKNLFNKLNNQMNANINANLKFWSELTSEYSDKSSEIAKSTAEFLKKSTLKNDDSKKKQESYNK